MSLPSQARVLSALSIPDYLNGEADGSIRHEYIDGQVYAMAGGSARHNLIAVNAGSLLNTRLPETCEVFVADMKVRIHRIDDSRFYYPDVMVCCREDDKEACYRESLCLIIEVLSDAAYSDENGHPFRGKVGTHSEGKWAPIPREMGGAGIADSAGREFLPQ
uniref:Restriction endonuclease n=2 Tax=Candidatus Kentrum sp. UNK TaxID=2126344 RepID=A0A451ANY8_9GAMM|nr:MAG: Putative restriction endonuclease [Candidatus Kentron sp. UNK]